MYMNRKKAYSQGTSEHILHPPCWCLRTVENLFLRIKPNFLWARARAVRCDDMDNVPPCGL